MDERFVCLFVFFLLSFISLHFYFEKATTTTTTVRRRLRVASVYRAYNMPQLPEINEMTLYLSSKTVKLYV